MDQGAVNGKNACMTAMLMSGRSLLQAATIHRRLAAATLVCQAGWRAGAALPPMQPCGARSAWHLRVLPGERFPGKLRPFITQLPSTVGRALLPNPRVGSASFMQAFGHRVA